MKAKRQSEQRDKEFYMALHTTRTR